MSVNAKAQSRIKRAERAEPAATPAPELETGGILTIDLDTLVANWRLLASRAAPAECAAVVKADAYGCGIEPVATALARAGCHTFFVADLAEARRVRAVAPSAVIYVLNGLVPESAPAFADADVQPVIGNLLELAEWDTFRKAHDWHGGAALHFDTGMNRLGLSITEASALAARLNSTDHGISLVMSHFACADTPMHPLNERQIAEFREIRMLFRGITASLANSSGVFLSASAHFDLVRPGVALYGANPTPGRDNPMRPVVELTGRVVQTRDVPRGETVGYGATWTAKRETRLAVVSIGYADGYPRALSETDDMPGGEVIVAGRHCPLAGRISMDLLAVDVTDLPDGTVRRGDHVTLIGGDIGVDDVAAWAGTIGYEILTNLGRRYHRVYRGG
ncbi:MAG TPA: alanine racemase [Xanthobacteraceae bacterium]|nr:alanine racemase [Xanthobacteraceae bacterium]